MGTTTYTVAQALATNASGILVADTAATIATNLSNASLVSRVSLFSMSANGAVAAWEAAALAAAGSEFSTAGYTLTVRDSVAQLTASVNAAGVTISGIVVAVRDTAADILAAANNTIIRNASSIALTANATLTLAQLLTLEAFPSFTAAGLTLTLGDSAANLLAFTPSEAKAALTVFQVGVNSTVTAAQAITLEGMSHFGLAAGVTLTISDSLANLSADTASLNGVLLLPGTAVNVTDTVTNLLAQATSFQWSSYPNASATLSSSATVTASQAATLASLPNFTVASGQSLTIADTVSDLVTLSSGQAAIASAITLAGNDTATAAQLAVLATLPHFSAGHTLTLDDTLANLATLTTAQHALASAETIDDTVSHLLAAQSSALSGANAIVAELDGTTLDTGQATALAALAAHATLTLHANGSNTTLTISGTASDLSAAAASITTLEADGPVTVVPIGSSNGSILSASAAAALVQSGVNPANGIYAVADSGSALSSVAAQLFGQGFEAITVTSGSFAGTMAQLLDPTLHFVSGSSAQLNADAIPDVAQALALAALPGFNLATSVTLAVDDTITNILAAAAALPTNASSILANDSESVSATAAATLAALTGFSLHGNYLFLYDTAANLVAATPGAIALATTVNLTSDARISAAAALQFVDMGLKFSPNGFFVTIADTAGNLEALAASPSALAVVNGWAGEAVLSANATVDVANATALSQFAGFNVGTYYLTISDSAANLLGASSSVLALAYAVQISLASTVTAADAATLESLHNFSANSLLTIADTPADLAAMVAPLATPASSVSLATETTGTGGNASGYAIDAAQFAAMLALPHFSLTGFAGTVAVTDTAASLAALAPSLSGLSSAVLSHIATTLGTSATVTVAIAEALHGLPDFSVGSSNLTISDTAANIATLDSGTAALASSIVTIGGSSSLSVAEFDSLVGASGFIGTPGSMTVSDTAANLLTLVGSSNLTYIGSTVLSASTSLSAADAERLSTLPHLLIGNNLAIADTAADLLHITGTGSTPDDWAIELQASSVVLTASATVNAAQATLLTQLGSRFSAGTSTLTVQDTPTALLGLTTLLGPIAGQVSSVALASGSWTISLAQAQQLGNLPGFNAGSASVTIADSVANLSAGVNASLIASIIASTPTITLTLAGNDTASVAQAEALHALGSNFSRGGSTLTIIDGAGHLATLDAGSAALASAIGLQGSTLTSVANFQAIRALPNYSDNGNLLVVSDTAAHLLTLVGSDVSLAAEIMLSTDATNLSAFQAEQLATLTNFTTGIAHFTILDSAADLLQISGSGPQPDDWAGELAASSVTLTGIATVTAAQSAVFALLGSRFNPGGYTLTVSDSAANLVASANAAGLALAGAVTLSGDETALSAANATLLAALGDFTKGAYSVTVSDAAANLAFAGNAAGLALADHVQLSLASSMTVAAAEALIGMTNFQVNDAAPITIADTLPDLLGLASASLAHNGSVLAATPIELSTSAVATVAQMEALAALAQYSTFSLNGNTITVEDSGRHLASFTADTIAVPAAYVMIGDATLSAAQAGLLAAENVQLGDNNLTVADTPAALLSLSSAVNALATGLILSGAATVTAAQAAQLETLASDHRFSTAGDAITVTDTATALLGLSGPAQQMAATLALSESGDTVSVANLVQLAELGSRFSLNGHTLTVSDTATQLATLNSLETALTSSAVLDQTATVDTTTATELAALPGFALGGSVTLTVQGSYAELAALPSSITSIATLELTGSAQTLTAAQAAALAGEANFTAGAGVIVQDTIADLNAVANAGWQIVATGGYIVTDSLSNLLGNASTALLAHANSVTLLGDAQVDATDFATLAGMANFSRGTAALAVVDGVVAIADNAAAIALVASSALVDSSAPVSAAQAEALGNLNAAHMLSFAGGVILAVQDSFANLTSAGDAAGLALAGTITVVGTGAQLAAATAYGWGTVQPYYELTASGDITGPQAAALQAAGSHYQPQSYMLTVVDDAANVVGNATAIQALGISAQVSDSVAGVDAEATALGALGSTLESITLTDTSPVTAADAAGLSPLVAKLTGPAIAVADTASAVDANLAALEALGTHLSIVTVNDSAADVAAVASGLAALALGTPLTINLTDATPITLSADVAAALAPVDTLLGGTAVNVSDTGAHVAADAAALAGLGGVLGTVTLSDGTATNATTAVALAQIDRHLGTGVTLSVTDTAAAITGAATGLGMLLADGRLGAVVAADETVAHVLSYGAALAGLGATATISDSAANVSGSLDALEALGGGVVTQIALSDGGTPDIAVSLHQITSDAGVLGLISPGSFKYAITDTAADIAGDLGAGGGSQILTLGSAVDTITVSDSSTLTLTAGTLLAPGVDDSGTAALTRLAGGTSVTVTGVTIGEFAAIDLLPVAPGSFAVVDSGANIAADLESGSSVLLAHLAGITGIAPTGTITLTDAAAMAAHVDDGAGSVFSKMPGATLVVTGVPVSDIGTLFTAGVPASSIAVSDTAAHVAADLETASPMLVQYIGEIASIAVSPSGAVSLDANHALASGVDDGAGSVFGKMTGDTLAVTGAMVAQLDSLHALYLVPGSVAVSDAASTIATDLALGASSRLETYAADGMLTAVAVTSGPVSLADSYVSAVGDALALLPASSLQVTDVPISDVAHVAGLAALASMTVSDSAANIQADLILDGSSELALHHGAIASVTVTGGPISLTDAQALAASTTALAVLPLNSLDVTGVAVADIATIAAIIALSGMTVSDTAANVTADLQLGSAASELELNAAKITSVTATGGTVSLSDTAAWAVTAALADLAAGSLTVTGASVAHAATYGALTALVSMTVADTAAAVHADLTGGSSVLEIYAAAGTITGITVNDAAVVTLTDTQAELVLAALRVLSDAGGLTVSGVSVADIATIVALTALTGMTITDSATDIHNDLVLNTASELYQYRTTITGVTVTGGQVDIASTDVANVQLAALALLPAGTLVVTGVLVSGVAGMAGLAGLYQMTVSDTAANVQSDLLLGGSSVLETNHALIGGIAVTGGTVTLADSATSSVMAALALLSGPGTLAVTAVSVADVAAIGALTALGHMTVSDTAANIDGDLVTGASSVLEQNAGLISNIGFSSGSSVALTGAQAALVMAALAELPAGSLMVTGALVSQVGALGALGAFSSMTVTDTAANIAADLALGATSQIETNIANITSIGITAGTVGLTYAEVGAVTAALAKLPSSSLTVDTVPVAHIGTVTGLGAVLVNMAVQDTGSAVQTDLNLGAASAIETNAGSISAVSLSTGSVTLTDGAADLVLPALALLPSGSLTVTGVPVADLSTIFGLGAPLAGMTVTDTGGDVATDLISGTAIETALGKITSISLSSGSVALTDTQANGVLNALALLPVSSLTISAVPVSDIVSFSALTALSAMAVHDTGATITADLALGAGSVIDSNLGKVSGITLSSGSVALTDAQADAVFAALADLPNGSLTVSGVPVSDVAHLASLGPVLAGLMVTDSATDVQTDLASGSVLATNASAISSISLTGGPVTLTDAQADGASAVLGKLPAASLVVTGVPVADIGTITALTALAHMTVSDTGAAIQADLALSGSSVILAHVAEISSVTVSDTALGATVAAAIYQVLGSTFVETALTISDTAANLLSVAAGAEAGVLALAATVQLSANANGLTAAQATTLAGLLHGTSSGDTVNILDTAANLLGSGNAVGIALATTVGVSDTAANILASAPALIAMEPQLTSAAITDSGPLSASAVSDLLALPNLSAGALTIADTGSQIAAAIEANGATGVTFLEAHSVQLSVNSIIGASDAAALEQLGGSLNKNGFTISVSDTASHLTDTADGYLAAVSDTSLVNGVYLKTTGGAVTVTAAVGAALIGIPNFHKNPVGSGTNILIVQDTATHFDSSYATLHTDLALFDHLYLSTSATVTDAVYGELLALGVQRAGVGVTLTVRDTASNIAANAAGQLGGSPSITPIAWQLSASATVSESQAAALGGLGGFSAGAYMLTLSASASGVSVSDANALGVLGSAFHLGGFTIDVTGSVATLSGLTSAALTVVTPQISDLFSNIAAMSPGSGLLGGTMTVTDSEAVTVAQATSFFALVQVGSGSGIPAGNITFSGGVETITDTLTNVQTLTGLSSWTGNASLRTDFHLEVADTVANLINPANTTALSGMSATTLSGNQTVTAASLETLFTLESTIHFSLGGNQLTIQDAAADLLNPTYSDAVAMAQHLTLLGPDTVVAADAETLMATGKLVLTSGTILTISDTSSDLLDGVLGGAITGGGFTSFVHVSLSDNETLDAQTAEALVSLPGYTAGSNTLSIVDGASYLLNAANHAAELDATSVTLDGDAYVSAATAVSLVGLPHFGLDGNTLYLASNDYADAVTLTTLAGLGSGFNLNGNTLTLTQNASVNATQLAEIGDFGVSLHANGHSLTMTQDALALTPSEYAAVQSDNVVLSGHALSAMPTGVSVSEVSGNVEFDGTGVNGAAVTLYAADGSVVTTTSASPLFTVSAAESGSGINVAATETVGGTESAPIIALEQTILTGAATADGATFATSGQVQVGTNEYMNLYTAGSQPGSPANPILVYDPTAHTLSFDAAGHSDVVLLTLGTATHPASLDPSEIFVKHYVA